MRYRHSSSREPIHTGFFTGRSGMSVYRDSGCLFSNAILCKSFWSRSKGLIGIRQLPEDTAFVLSPCSSIHMFGMRINLDIIYLGEAGEVLKLVEGLKPFQISAHGKSKCVVECAEGRISALSIRIGQRLRLGTAAVETK